jgi:predicted O-linked N-acetylglucosamine transferase (SPINDLY family)
MLRRAGQTQEALNAYKAALLSQPELPFASSRIGCLLAVLGHFAQADAIFKIIGERYGGREKILRFGDDFLGAAVAQHHAQSERFRQMLAGADDIGQAQVVIHASCDSHYFGLFADVFCAGIARYSGLHALVVLHVVGPSVETKAQVAQLRKAYPQLPLVVLEDSVDLSAFGTHAKTYYACARFLSLPAVLEKYQRPVLTLDIDTLTLQPLGAFTDQLSQSQAPFALIKGEPLEPWGYYWANLVWVRPEPQGLTLAEQIAHYIARLLNPTEALWFLDQAALFAICHPAAQGPQAVVHTLSPDILNSKGNDCLFWNVTYSQSANHGALGSDLYLRHKLFALPALAASALTPPNPQAAVQPADDQRFAQGVLLFQEDKASEAAALFSQLVHDYPTLDKAWNNLGLSQVRLGKLAEARESYKKAIALAPNSVSALSNYASLLINAGELAEAEQHLLHALSREKTHVQSIVNYALLLAARREFKKSIAFYEQALAVAPDAPDVLTNYAAALMELGQYSSAMLALRRSQKARPHAYADRANLAHCLTSQGRIDEALAEYGDGSWMESAPMQAHSNRLLTMQYSDKLSQEEIFQAHVQWGQRFGGKACYDFPNWKAGKKRPRIGFVSSDFNAHPVGFFILPVLEGLRGTEIDVYLYPSNAFTDPITAQIRSLCDVWRPIVALTAKAAADVIYQDKIDLLIDLNGHTRGNRLDVFALKPAPKQATWIGYPDTTGLPEMDYRFVDSITDPPGEADRWCTEKLIRLDPCFLVYKPIAQLPEITPAPHLKNGYLTFGSFNNISKISPTTINIWSKILTHHAESRLLMKATATSDEGVKERLWAEFEARGIEKARVGFLSRTRTHNEHLSTYNLIDLALDTFPYSGTTTTFEAISMGVEVKTFFAQVHRSRVTLSINQLFRITEQNLWEFEPHNAPKIELTTIKVTKQKTRGPFDLENAENRHFNDLFFELLFS